MNRFPTPLTTLATLLASVLLFSACSVGGLKGSDVAAEPSAGVSTGVDNTDGNAPAGLDDVPVNAYVDSDTRAVVVGAGLDVHDAPNGEAILTLGPTTTFGTTRVLLVEEDQGDWLKVRLPTRPNHRSGWIRAEAVALETLELEVIVDLEARTLTVRDGLDVIAQSTVAIGSTDNPTPTGTFYVTDKLEAPNPDGAYGPYAFGLSGYSDTLTEFAGGDGQIGIHGTNDPDSIGEAVSHGCVRLPNDVIAELAGTLPLGTPVHII